MDEPLDGGKNLQKVSLMHRAPVNFQLAFVKKPVCIHEISCRLVSARQGKGLRTDRWTNRWTNQMTNLWTDTPFYRVLAHNLRMERLSVRRNLGFPIGKVRSYGPKVARQSVHRILRPHPVPWTQNPTAMTPGALIKPPKGRQTPPKLTTRKISQVLAA